MKELPRITFSFFTCQARPILYRLMYSALLALSFFRLEVGYVIASSAPRTHELYVAQPDFSPRLEPLESYPKKRIRDAADKQRTEALPIRVL